MFNPATLQPFEVIQVYYQFEGQPPDYKYFVVVCHEEHAGRKYVNCFKATSKTEKYENDKSQMAGCVYYKQGESKCFPEKTVIQPDNLVPIPHTYLIEQEKQGKYKHHGKLPDEFREKAVGAVKASMTISTKRKPLILQRLEAHSEKEADSGKKG